ncbi:MAG: hypothetical protein NUV65_06600 [Candidatus Roizmanbacteria bacterium]|nr:hypothetical protein [Candidatus Roizmanbacteria bacterium]
MKKAVLLALAISIAHIFILFTAFLFIVPQIHQTGFFPYGEFAQKYNMNPFFTSLANFDGAHYLLIAEGVYYQIEYAFFPLYPILIHMVGFVVNKNLLVSGLVISNAAFVGGLAFLSLVLSKIENKNILSLLLLYVAFPTSFYFHTVYTESLFLFFFMGALFFFQKKQWARAGIFGFFSALTRLFGVLLAILFVYQAYLLYKKTGWKILALPFLPIAGFMLYALFLLKTTGDPLAFFHAQSAFAARSTNLVLLPQVYYRYIKILFTAQFDFAYVIACMELFLFTICMTGSVYVFIKKYKDWKENPLPIFLAFFSILSILIPTFTGTFSSIPRYSLFAFSFFIALSHLPKKVQLGIGGVFLVCQLTLFCFFLQGYFVS